MSVRAQASGAQRHERMPREAYYTPAWATHALLHSLPLIAMARHEVWEPAAGAGHMAKELALFLSVFATDVAPPVRTVHPVLALDFLASSGLSGAGVLSIITNPPYGPGNRLALAFLDRALDLVQPRRGVVALLLPFEFDARASRHELVGGHPAFAAKITLGRRVRWLNLPQAASEPMGHHSWFVWAFDKRIRETIRAAGVMRTV